MMMGALKSAADAWGAQIAQKKLMALVRARDARKSQ